MIGPSDFALREVVDAEAIALHPVWAPYGDAGDRELILSWGVEADRLDRELVRYDDCGPSMHFPVLALQPLPRKAGVIVAARFVGADGRSLEGWVMPPHAFGLFADGHDISFNRTLPGMAAAQLRRLGDLLGSTAEPLFPIRYESGLEQVDAGAIRGEIARFW